MQLLQTKRRIAETARGAAGAEGFELFYQSTFGERWPELRLALLAPAQHVLRVNGYADVSLPDSGRYLRLGSDLARSLTNLQAPAIGAEPACAAARDAAGRRAFYAMDPASVLAALALAVQPGERVLDLCAAPGGKTLILAELLGEAGELVSNDRSSERRRRLKQVLSDYLPAHVRENIKVTGHDATRWGLYERDCYDAVLLDAPCSSERHVLNSPRALAQWSPSRSKRLAAQQFAMMASALQALKPGGRLVYCTCALAPAENDEVVRRLLQSKKHSALAVPAQSSLGERTEFGWLILPDRTGFGPLYFAALEKPA